MNILVCVKRVPATSARITLTADAQAIDTKYLGFTVSPHEECAVEEAVRIVEAQGGSSTVLTLGPDAAAEQLRDAMSIGIDDAILLETDGREWDAAATANAIVAVVRARQAAGKPFDLLLFGNESADSGGFQVGVRVAHALDWPCVTGLKGLSFANGHAQGTREASGGRETLTVSLPAVFTVKEGLNLPRYPSLPGRLKAKKKPLERITPQWQEPGLAKVRLKLPSEKEHQVEILGKGADAAPKAVELLQKLGVIPR
jgi:electron transfer flavoprotein beta subunit